MLPRVQYEPWSLLNQWRRDVERAFNNLEGEDGVSATAWSPAVDIQENKDAYVLRADVPGVDPKDIDLNMENGVLTIRGERKSETRQEAEDYQRVERVSGTFYRRFTLPDSADAEKISAKSNNGVLEVTIPKQAKVQPRRIEIQS